MYRRTGQKTNKPEPFGSGLLQCGGDNRTRAYGLTIGKWYYRKSPIRPFWAAARVRRTSVLQSKTSAQAEFISAEHDNHQGVERPAGAEPQKNSNLRPDPLETVYRRTGQKTNKPEPFGSGLLQCGGDNRTRICDLPRVRRTLYRLSYASILNG